MQEDKIARHVNKGNFSLCEQFPPRYPLHQNHGWSIIDGDRMEKKGEILMPIKKKNIINVEEQK